MSDQKTLYTFNNKRTIVGSNGLGGERAPTKRKRRLQQFEPPTVKLSDIVRKAPQGVLVQNHKISAVDKYITDIDKVAAQHRQIETLFLSNNCIASLENIEQFDQLRVLSMANNCLASLYDINHLTPMYSLHVLNLEFNPITQLPYYRYHVIARCPNIRILDNKEVSNAERQRAKKLLEKEETTLNLMFSNECLIAKMARGVEDVRLDSNRRDEICSKIKGIHVDGIDASTCLDIWELPEVYSEEDRVVVYDLLRKEVRKIHNVRIFGGGQLNDKVQLPSQHKKKLLKKRGTDTWEICFSEVLLHQQTKIAQLLFEIEQETKNMANQPVHQNPFVQSHYPSHLDTGAQSSSNPEAKKLLNTMQHDMQSLARDMHENPVTSPTFREKPDPALKPSPQPKHPAHHEQQPPPQRTQMDSYHEQGKQSGSQEPLYYPNPFDEQGTTTPQSLTGTTLAHTLPPQHPDPRQETFDESDQLLKNINTKLQEKLKEYREQNEQNFHLAKKNQQTYEKEIQRLRQKLTKAKAAHQLKKQHLLEQHDHANVQNHHFHERKEDKQTTSPGEISNLQDHLTDEDTLDEVNLDAASELDDDLELENLETSIDNNLYHMNLKKRVLRQFQRVFGFRCALQKLKESYEFNLKRMVFAHLKHAVVVLRRDRNDESRLKAHYFHQWRQARTRAKRIAMQQSIAVKHDHVGIAKKYLFKWANATMDAKERADHVKEVAIKHYEKTLKRRAMGAINSFLKTIQEQSKKTVAFQSYRAQRCLVKNFYTWRAAFRQRQNENTLTCQLTIRTNQLYVKSLMKRWHTKLVKKQKRQELERYADHIYMQLVRKRVLNKLIDQYQRQQAHKVLVLKAYDFYFMSLRRQYFEGWKRFVEEKKATQHDKLVAKRHFGNKFLQRWRSQMQQRQMRQRENELVNQFHARYRVQHRARAFYTWRRKANKNSQLHATEAYYDTLRDSKMARRVLSTWKSKLISRMVQSKHSVQEAHDYSTTQLQQLRAELEKVKHANLQLINRNHQLAHEIGEIRVADQSKREQLDALQTELEDQCLVSSKLRHEIDASRKREDDLHVTLKEAKNLERSGYEVREQQLTTEHATDLLRITNSEHKLQSLQNHLLEKNLELQRTQYAMKTLEENAENTRTKLVETFDMADDLRHIVSDQHTHILHAATMPPQSSFYDIGEKPMKNVSKKQNPFRFSDYIMDSPKHQSQLSDTDPFSVTTKQRQLDNDIQNLQNELIQQLDH